MLGRFASARKLKWIARGKRRRERKVLKGGGEKILIIPIFTDYDNEVDFFRFLLLHQFPFHPRRNFADKVVILVKIFPRNYPLAVGFVTIYGFGSRENSRTRFHLMNFKANFLRTRARVIVIVIV